MPKLKPLLDAAKTADAKVKSILQEMTDAFESGTEEGKQKALDLRPTLDEAKKESEEANQLYVSARDASEEVDPDVNARKFVPAGDGNSQKSGAKEITRAEYEAMAYSDRHDYLAAGGAIVDNPVD